MVGLRRVLDAIGPGLLELVYADGDPDVRDVVVAEPVEAGDGDEIHPGDLVLGIGVREPAQAVELIGRCEKTGAAALLLREPVVAEPAVPPAAEAAGVALVAVHGRVSWAQLVWLLRGVVDTGMVGQGIGAAAEAPAFGDLFALADAAAAVVDAPVTIEDEHSRILAYSRRQEQADAARLSTIVGRRVPDAVLDQFRSQGVFRKLGRGPEPIFVPGQPDGTLPRLIVPVRVAGQLLGSIWAIVPAEPSADRVTAFADTAAVVALHLLRVRAAADVARQVAADRLRAVLRGVLGASADRRELGLPAGPYRVVALDVATGADEATDPGVPERRLALREAVTRASLGWRQPAVTELDGVLYAVVAADGRATDPGCWEWLRKLVLELARTEPELRAAAGGAVRALAGLPRSAAEAGALLRLLGRGFVPGPVARHEDAWAVVVLDRVTGAVPVEDLAAIGPLERILAGDESRGGWYAETLRAYLEHPGDPAGAARRLHVHPNTYRYRMRRLLAAVPVDLDSPEVRLALLIQLSALRLHGDVVRGVQDGGRRSSPRDDD